MENGGVQLEPADEPVGDAVGFGVHRRLFGTRGACESCKQHRQKRTNKKWIAYLAASPGCAAPVAEARGPQLKCKLFAFTNHYR
jgi:hypothetical protein